MSIAIVPTNGVNGNITTCGISEAIIQEDKSGPLSLTEVVHYRSYNLCTGETIRDYTLPQFTHLGNALMPIGILLGLVILAFSIVRLFCWINKKK